MKLERRHLLALGVAFIFIAMGLIQAITGKQLDKKVMDTISFVLLLTVAYLLFNGRNKRVQGTEQKPEEDTNNNEQNKAEDQHNPKIDE